MIILNTRTEFFNCHHHVPSSVGQKKSHVPNVTSLYCVQHIKYHKYLIHQSNPKLYEIRGSSLKILQYILQYNLKYHNISWYKNYIRFKALRDINKTNNFSMKYLLFSDLFQSKLIFIIIYEGTLVKFTHGNLKRTKMN